MEAGRPVRKLEVMRIYQIVDNWKNENSRGIELGEGGAVRPMVSSGLRRLFSVK